MADDMTAAPAGEDAAEAAHDAHEIRVTVNGRFVVLTSRKVTGFQVKEAAIAAGAAIQLDFVLSEVRPSGEQKIIPDDREITVKSGDEFWAIPGDDNS